MASAKFRVRATKTGYFNHRRVKAGEMFYVTEQEFSDANRARDKWPGWMERVGPGRPEKKSEAKK